jgi:hypothetical protein
MSNSTLGTLFNRKYAVYIGPQGQPGIKYTDLRVTFDIDKTSSSGANKAKIDIYNMSQSSRTQYAKKGLLIRLDAGYQNLLQTLYIGDIERSSAKRSGSEIIMTFEAGDSARALINSHFDKGYPSGTSAKTIINDLANELGVTVGIITGVQDVIYNNGVTFNGSVKRALEVLVKNQGLEFSVDNGILQIIPITKTNGQTAVVLSSSTGLIGVPSYKDSGIEFQALLNNLSNHKWVL